MRKKWYKIISGFKKKQTNAYLQAVLKAHVSFKRIGQKLWEELRGQGHFCNIRTKKMSKLKMRKKW